MHKGLKTHGEARSCSWSCFSLLLYVTSQCSVIYSKLRLQWGLELCRYQVLHSGISTWASASTSTASTVRQFTQTSPYSCMQNKITPQQARIHQPAESVCLRRQGTPPDLVDRGPWHGKTVHAQTRRGPRTAFCSAVASLNNTQFISLLCRFLV